MKNRATLLSLKRGPGLVTGIAAVLKDAKAELRQEPASTSLGPELAEMRQRIEVIGVHPSASDERARRSASPSQLEQSRTLQACRDGKQVFEGAKAPRE